MGRVERNDGWRIPDVLWSQIEPLIPSGKPHLLGCHNPRVPNRDAMTAILFVLRTGCQWNALKSDGHLLQLLGASALRGMDRSRRVRASVGDGAGGEPPSASHMLTERTPPRRPAIALPPLSGVGGARPRVTRVTKTLNIVVQEELVRRWTHPDRIELALALEVEPLVDRVLREDVAAQ
jgi:hypothetical protein